MGDPLSTLVENEERELLRLEYKLAKPFAQYTRMYTLWHSQDHPPIGVNVTEYGSVDNVLTNRKL